MKKLLFLLLFFCWNGALGQTATYTPTLTQTITMTPTITNTPVRVGPVVIDTPGAAMHVIAVLPQNLVQNLPVSLAAVSTQSANSIPTAVAQAVATITPLVGSGGGSSHCPGILKTSNYTLSDSDCLVVVNSSSSVTMTLPAATGSGIPHTVKTIGYGFVWFKRSGSDTIDGDDAIILTVPGSSIEVVDWSTGLWAIK